MITLFLLTDQDNEYETIKQSLEEVANIHLSKTLEDFVNDFNTAIPQIFILDNDTVGVNIAEISIRIKQNINFRYTPILIISQPPQQKDLLTFIKLGIKDFLVKPYSPELLKQKILEFIQKLNIVPNSKKIVPQALAETQTKKKRDEIFAQIDSLPAFPYVIQKIVQIIRDSKSSAADFEDYVMKDQVLTAKILRMANSSFYALNSEVVLIRDAVVTLGYNALRSIVYAVGSSDIFKKNIPHYGYAPGGIWKHSLACAAVARLLGEEFRYNEDEIEQLFICGLLHDLGKLILGQVISRDNKMYEKVINENIDICRIESKLADYSHCTVAVMIGQKWGLPPIIINTAKNHHAPEVSVEFVKETSIINIADYICNHLKIGLLAKNKHEYTANDYSCIELDISDERLSQLIEMSQERLKGLEELAIM